MHRASLRCSFGLCVATFAAAAQAATEAGGQQIPASAYLQYVPLTYLRLVRQTEESQLVQLYGDRASASYSDAAPLDGIDDARGRLLLALAVRFSPYLVRNTTSVPMDWRKFSEGRRSFPLHVDRWDLSVSPAGLVRREQIDFVSLRDNPCPDSEPEIAPLVDDCALVRLLRDFDPDRPADERARTLAD